MIDVVCHIGLHKTASGTLQRQFFPACPQLNLLTTLDPAVRKLVQEITRRDPIYFDPASALTLISPQLRSDRVNLLSNESLSGPPYAGVIEFGLDHRSPVLANLQATFPQARIVLVLRRQDALARSLYRQYLKRGGTAQPARFFGFDPSGRPPLLSLDRFQYSTFINELRRRFPRGMLVLTFEEFAAAQAQFLDRLCTYLGVQPPQIVLRVENSTRLGAAGMEITRLMNFALRSMLNQGVIPAVPVRRHGRLERVSVVEYIHEKWPGKPRASSKDALSAISGEIFERFRDDNRRIDGDLGLGLAAFGYY